MTKERREDVLLVALVCSVALHVGLMLLVRSQVMTRSVAPARHERTAPMRVTRAAPRPDPAKIEEILDLKAAKDAPAAVEEKAAPRAPAPSAEKPSARLPEPSEAPAVQAPDAPIRPMTVPDAPRVAGADTFAVVPLTKIETPKVSARADALPEFSVRVPTGVPDVKAALPALKDDPGSALAPAVLTHEREKEDEPAFKPAKEVYEKVDEAVVAAEKAAVRELVNADRAADLVPLTEVAMATAEADGWRYFRVTVTPKAALPVVPKDVVVIIDGSGSIGNDRLGSCRAAARRILRTCTNTGDRFNLVVFRNAYSYAFRTWQECTAGSFAAGDRWLSKETAHGRTDVFATIRSVLTLPRDPKRPLVALVVTDGDANSGVSGTAEILSKFTALNDGLVSVYMYGVKSSANRELIDVLTHGNRGESFVFDGWRWSAGDGMEKLSERFRDPVLSDLRVIFAAGVRAEAYPRLLRNLCRGHSVELVGRVPAAARDVAFSLRGVGGEGAYEGFYRLPFTAAPSDPTVVRAYADEAAIARKLGSK